MQPVWRRRRRFVGSRGFYLFSDAAAIGAANISVMEGNDSGSTPPGPPPPWSQHYPPAKPAQRWLPVAIIVAAIIIATSVISAVLLTRDEKTAAPAAPAPTSAGGAHGSSTCEAWPSTKAALNAIPQLPQGWDWSTPNIDTYIDNRTAAIAKALDLFEPAIAAEPADTSTTARKYVAERRREIEMLRNHTYTQADGVAATVASARLDQLCPALTTATGAEASSTCAAWPSTKAALNSIPALPSGWNWETPNIDVYISNQSAAVTKALDLFEPEIAAADPPQVVEAAKTYVSERRFAVQMLLDRTFTTADGVPATAARAKLDQVCGLV